jgi:hypothetical protein
VQPFGVGGYLKTAAMAAWDLGDSPLFLLDYVLRIVRVLVLVALWRTILDGRDTSGTDFYQGEGLFQHPLRRIFRLWGLACETKHS